MNAILAPVMVSSFSAQLSQPVLCTPLIEPTSQLAVSPRYESLLEDSEITQSPTTETKAVLTLASPESLTPRNGNITTVDVEDSVFSI